MTSAAPPPSASRSRLLTEPSLPSCPFLAPSHVRGHTVPEHARAGHRRRSRCPRGAGAGPPARGLRGGARLRRRRGSRRHRAADAGRRRPRRDDAGTRRAGRHAPAPPRGQSHPRSPPDRTRCRRRRRGRARRGCGRLPAEAVRARGAAGQAASALAPRSRQGAGRPPPLRRSHLRSRLDGRAPQRAEIRAHDDGSAPARAVHAQPTAGPAAFAHLRARVGIRLQPFVECVGRVRRLSPPQARGRGRAAPDPHRARHGLRPARAMSLRLRLTLVAASVVAIVVAAASVTTYFVMRHELYSQVDSTISQHAGRIQADPSFALSGFGPFNGDTTTIVSTNGQSAGRLPIDARIRAVAAGSADGFYRDTTIAGYSFREIVAPVPGLGAIVVGRNIDYLHHDLERLRLILLLVSIGGTAVAAAAGALVSRATLSPVLRLTAAAERITKTGDPSERVLEGGRGEL